VTHCATALSAELNQGLMANKFILDSGASAHMCFEDGLFTEIYELNQEVDVTVGNQEQVPALGWGRVILETAFGLFELEKVLFVPKLSANLISYTKLMQEGYTISNNQKSFLVKSPTGEKVLSGETWNGLLRCKAISARTQYPDPPSSFTSRYRKDPEEIVLQTVHQTVLVVGQGAYMKKNKAPLPIWHKRLAHINTGTVQETEECVNGMIIDKERPGAKDVEGCLDCMQYKMTAQAYQNMPLEQRLEKYKEALSLVYADLGDRGASVTKNRYFLVIRDVNTRFTWTFPMQTKDETHVHVQQWLAKAQNQQHGKLLQHFRCDRGGEFVDWARVKNWLENRGVEVEYCDADQHQQIGMAEAAVRDIKVGTAAMLKSCKLEGEYWAEALRPWAPPQLSKRFPPT